MLQLLALVAVAQAGPIERDSYGVAHIYAPTAKEAFYHAGYAVAQDRLWQMEQSRRLARGRLSEVFGPTTRASDREVLATAYTDAELQAQIDRGSAEAKAALESYAEGVNAYIAEAEKAGKLPEGFAKAGFKPAAWKTTDSAAIAIRMAQLFGTGGAGELRNLALLEYLKTQPAKDRALDVLDDFVWLMDARSPVTVKPEDDPLQRTPFPFNRPTREATQAHLDQLPKLSLFELLPALGVAERRASTLVAESRSVPYRTGSYAVVVGSQRSATGRPLLLSAPQMGFTNPSIVHEISIATPDWGVAGIGIPGSPGIVIGHNRHLAWGLTSGVADTEDIFVVKLDGEDGYLLGDRKLKFEKVSFALPIKGQAEEKVEQLRTELGPVILLNKGNRVAFVRRSSHRMRELEGINTLHEFVKARSASDLDRSARNITMSFNLFYATSAGDIGYRYCGLVPIRANGLDPRLPTPAEPRNDWAGMIPPDRMPHVRNPKGGLIANWNNKPVSWWANGDTPAWGRVFRSSALERMLGMPKIAVEDVEMAAWGIARYDFTWPGFAPHVQRGVLPLGLSDVERQAAAYLLAFDGRSLAGTQSAAVYRAFFNALREELFVPTVGNFMQPSMFQTAAQPSVMLEALEGKTKVDYLRDRTAQQVVLAAFKKAVARLSTSGGPDPSAWRFVPSTLPAPDGPPIPYRDRGTYIQIVELFGTPSGRNVTPPGVAEIGPHASDQAPLSRAWTYKPMRIRSR